MKILAWIIGTIACSTLGTAQNFEFTAGDTLVRSFYLNDYTTSHTTIANHSENEVVFEWELITFDHPEGWEFSLCDYPLCYTLGETTGTMNPAGPHSNHAFLSINVEAISVDTGFYQIKVWDQLLPELTDTLTVQMISIPSYASQIELNETFQPIIRLIGDELMVYNRLNESIFIKIYDLNGSIHKELELAGNNFAQVSVSHLSKGIYLASIQSTEQQFPVIRFSY